MVWLTWDEVSLKSKDDYYQKEKKIDAMEEGVLLSLMLCSFLSKEQKNAE